MISGDSRTCLAIETATGAITAAIFRDAALVSAVTGSNPLGRAEELSGLVHGLLQESGIRPSDIEIVATTTGPGSFTGIRVGLAFCKGFSAAVGAQVRLVSLLKAFADCAAEFNREWMSVVRTGANQATVMKSWDGGVVRLSAETELQGFLSEQLMDNRVAVCDSRLSEGTDHPAIVTVTEPFAVLVGRAVLQDGFVSEDETTFLAGQPY